jgi:hypothetical protein
MVWLHSTIEDRDCAPEKCFCFLVAALLSAVDSEVVERQGRFRVTGAERALLCFESAFVEPFGLIQASTPLEGGSQVVQVDRDLVIVGTVRALEQTDRFSERLGCLIMLPERVENRRVRGLVGGYVDVSRAERLLSNPDRATRVGFRVGEVTAGVLEPAKVVVDRRYLGGIGSKMVDQDSQRSLVVNEPLVEAP